MDPSDFDQTQAIFLDEPDEDDGTDELLPDTERQPKSFLKVLFQKGMTEKSYPLYEGENIIGRSEDTCHVCIASKALSKEHACIEIIKDSHLLYDKGSRNKTKRGKLFLSPNVRYEINSNDEISFADIKCVYTKHETNNDISLEADGSETDGSENFLLQMEISKEKNTTLSPVKPSIFAHINDSNVESAADEKNDDDSLLQPTQTFAAEKSTNPDIRVQETPEKEYNEKYSTLVLSESESEDEEKDRPKKSSKSHLRSSTGTSVLCGDSDPDSSIDSENFNIATQAYFSESEKDVKSTGGPSAKDRTKCMSPKHERHKPKACLMDEPTQAVCLMDEPTQAVCLMDEPTQACLLDEPTQAFMQKDDEKHSDATVAAKSPSSQLSLSAKDKSTTGTQSFDVTNEDTAAEKSDQADLVSTQVFEEDDDDDDVEMVSILDMATMAPEEFVDENEDDDCEEGRDPDEAAASDLQSETMPVKSDSALPVSEKSPKRRVAPNQTSEATLKIDQEVDNNNKRTKLDRNKNNDKTQGARETVDVTDTLNIGCSTAGHLKKKTTQAKSPTSKVAATLVIEQDESDSDSEEENADTMACGGETQPYGNGSPRKGNKRNKCRPVPKAEEPTQAYGNDFEMETQAYDEDDTGHCGGGLHGNLDEPTQAYQSCSDDATQAFSDFGNAEKNTENDSTQVIAFDEPMQKIAFDESTQVFADDDPTQKVAIDEPMQTVALDEPTQVFAEDEPTQMVAIDEPTQKIGFDESTQVFDDDDPTQKMVAMGELLQTIDEEEETQRMDDDEPTQMIAMDEPTQKFDIPENDDLPAAGSGSRKEEDSASDDDSDVEETSMLKTDGLQGNEATQVFDMQPLYPGTCNEEVQPTLKYDMEINEKQTLKYDMEIDEKDSPSGQDIEATEGKHKTLLKSDGGHEQKAPKDSSKQKPENHGQQSASDNECYSYPLSPCFEDIGKDDDTEERACDVQTSPSKSSPNPLTCLSPLKPALVDRKRSPSPTPPKRVTFVETTDEISPKESNLGTRQNKRSSLKGVSAKGKKQSEAEENVEIESVSSASKPGRKRLSRNTGVSEAKGATDLMSGEVTKKESTKLKGVAEKKSEDVPETVSRRGRTKRGVTSKSEQEKEPDSKSLPVISSTEEQSKISLDCENEVNSAAINDAKRAKGKNLKGKDAKDPVTKESHSETGPSAIANPSPKPSGSSDCQNLERDEKAGAADESLDTGEDLESVSTTSRRGRRITKSTMFKDFETGVPKKRESLTKLVKTRTRKSTTGRGKETEDEEATLGRDAKETEVEPPASTKKSTTGKVKETEDEEVNQNKDAKDTEVEPPASKRKSKTVKGKESEDEEVNQGKDAKETEVEPPASKRKSKTVKGKEREDEEVNQGKDAKEAEVELPSSKRKSKTVKGKKTEVEVTQSKDAKETEVEPATRNPPSSSVQPSTRKRKKDSGDGMDVVDKSEILDEESEKLGSSKRSGRGKKAKIDEVKQVNADKNATTETYEEKKVSRTRGRGKASVETPNKSKKEKDNDDSVSSKAVKEDKEPPMQGKRGSRKKVSSQEEPKANNSTAGADDVQQPSQEATRGKRKTAALENEEEIPSTPAKRAKSAAMLHSPSLRHSTMDNKPKVMFTGVIDEQGEKTVKDLGGELVTKIQDCTHLVTDKIRRTVKFLGGLAKGALIVSQLWLDSSKRAGMFLDGHKYLVKDPDIEKQYKFKLANSIATAKKQALLSDFKIHVTKSVKPDANQMRDILQCAGAEVLPKMPSKAVEKTVVISCPEDEKLCKPAIKAKITVVTAEFILTGILQQKRDTGPYILFQ